VADTPLRGSRCTVCGHLSCPPEAFCPAGHGRSTVETTLAGRGTVYTSTVVHVPHAEYGAPYQVAYVDLEEGPRLFGQVIPPQPPLEPDAEVDISLEVEEAEGSPVRVRVTFRDTTEALR
jgi:uncharacterized OB-fold protein